MPTRLWLPDGEGVTTTVTAAVLLVIHRHHGPSVRALYSGVSLYQGVQSTEDIVRLTARDMAIVLPLRT